MENLEPEHVTKILSLAGDATSVVSFAAACRKFDALTKKVQGQITFDYSQDRQRFIDSLPSNFVGVQNRNKDDRISHLEEACKGPDLVTEKHDLDERFCVPPHGYHQIVTLVVTGCYGDLTVSIGGMTIVSMHKDWCLRVGGTIDLMQWLRFLPVPAYHEIWIHASNGGKLTLEHVKQTQRTACQWEILQIWPSPAYVYPFSFTLPQGATCFAQELHWHHPGVGFFIMMDEPELATITLHLNEQSFSGPARPWWTGKGYPKSFELPFAVPNSYYIPLAKKVNFSRVNHASLQLQFKKPATKVTTIGVYYINSNFLKFGSEMMGVMFAC